MSHERRGANGAKLAQRRRAQRIGDHAEAAQHAGAREVERELRRDHQGHHQDHRHVEEHVAEEAGHPRRVDDDLERRGRSGGGERDLDAIVAVGEVRGFAARVQHAPLGANRDPGELRVFLLHRGEERIDPGQARERQLPLHRLVGERGDRAPDGLRLAQRDRAQLGLEGRVGHAHARQDRRRHRDDDDGERGERVAAEGMARCAHGFPAPSSRTPSAARSSRCASSILARAAAAS